MVKAAHIGSYGLPVWPHGMPDMGVAMIADNTGETPLPDPSLRDLRVVLIQQQEA